MSTRESRPATDRQAIVDECERMWETLNGWAQDKGLTEAERYSVADAMLSITDLQNRVRGTKGQVSRFGTL